jgi:eukaryotic-like serine/threonine-protein kinase
MVRELEPGDPVVIGPYRLRGQLGLGGMGRVFLGLSAGGRVVAVKVIRADLAMDPEFRARFQREVAVARRVSHQFTAPVIDADLDGPVPWLATAYVAGPSLADAVAEHGALPARTVLKLAAGLAEGLSAIHAAGVVHRDLKPSNVLLAGDGPRVIDFGISLGGEGGALTRTGLVMGSPGFMSPEQAEGREVGPASDIFSLGAVLTFAATGEGPFGSGSSMTLVHRLVTGQARLDRVPAAVRPLVEHCLAADPRQRPTASDLLAGMGVAEPAVGWLPDRMTRVFSRYQASAAAPEVDAASGYVPTAVSRRPKPIGYAPTTISAVPTQALAPETVASAKVGPQPSQPQGRPNGRRRGHRGRRLAIALVVTGLSGALGAGGVALAASAHGSPGAHSGMGIPMQMTSPTTSAPRTSAPAPTDPGMSAPASMPPAPAPSMSAPTSPAGMPSATASPTPTPTATGSPTPTPSPTPTGGAPTPTGGAPTPTGGAPTPTGGTPTPTGGAPAPTGGAPTAQPS